MNKKRRSSKRKTEGTIKLENRFITYFQERCKYLNVSVPKFIVYTNANKPIIISPMLDSNYIIEIHLHRDSSRNEKLKLECKGYKLSILTIDTIFFTINKFNNTTVLKFQNCRITADEIVKITTNLIETGCVRDINLDMNPNSRGNHYLLCSGACKLHYLSLKFCNVGDSGVEKIADELKYQDNNVNPPTLVALNLMHNQITNVGAIFIAKRMLHTNRSIQSLNLSGNWITDTGALSILIELYMFPLTHEEIVELRKRKYARLMKQEDKAGVRDEATLNIPKNMSWNMPKDTSKTSLDFRSLESDTHPFINESYPIKGVMMTTGNLVLQHLNLSYNHLTTKSLQQMVKCIYYHSYMMLKDFSRGLLYVNLNGNDITEDNELWSQLYDLLNRRQNNIDDSRNYESLVPAESKILRIRTSI